MKQTAVQRVVRKHPNLVSKKFGSWLGEVVFELKNGSVKYTRRQMAILTEAPCTHAPKTLARVCLKYHIHSIEDLYRVGMRSLLRCTDIGERAVWIAALILEDNLFNVDTWMDRKESDPATWRAHIRLVSSQTRKQKHG